ncbi:MAG: SDR family NAD(P)-dependent oxidoreductase [Verrucomicrobia bacterium]|nr:SDR family NAD(P)-dependent oxidoreductase [Verrucomicrobiota bacterium]MBV8481748.1 SDR family NAD(P)-dependent oxidoreductase [Verrucomicrobiota bacterium]
MGISYFNGSTILITGASSGLGSEFARQLAPVAAKMVLVARRNDRLQALESELKARNTTLEVFARSVDLRDQRDIERFCDWLDESGFALDFLINNAGLGDHGPFINSEWERVNSLLQVNINALTYLTFRVLPIIKKTGRGVILNVSSIASFLPLPNNAVYASTKAYVTSFSEAVRAELRTSNVSVTVLCPGPVKTEYLSHATRAGDRSGHTAPFLLLPVEEVVRQALEAAAKDRARVVPGTLVNFVMTIVGSLPMFIKRLVYQARLSRAKPH